MKSLLFLTLGTILIFSTSCEKVIDLGIRDAESTYVIEGWVSNQSEFTYVKISKSLGLNADSDFEKISGATVSITDENGIQTDLTESEPGLYKAPGFIGTSYTSYDLEVSTNGEIFTATSTIPGNTAIDSLVYQENNGGFFGDGYTAFAYWTDKANEANNYRLKTIKNDTIEPGFFVTKDDLFNGIPTGTPLFNSTYQLNDTVILLLMECDPKTYDYYLTVSQIGNTQNPPASPGNPISNLSNNALGYFGGYNIALDTTIIE